jgi:hypothetical protein
MKWLLLLAIALFALSVGNIAEAATIKGKIDGQGHHYLILDGVISLGDSQTFAGELAIAQQQGYRLEGVQLNSPGGSVWDAVLIASMLGSIPDAITAVRKTDICESACFLIFAAGRRKYLEPRSQPLTQIGVHSFSVLAVHVDGTFGQNETPLVSAQMLWSVRRLKAIGVPDSVIGKMVTTPPNKMSHLTTSEVKAMGTAIAGVDAPGSTMIRALRDPDPLMVAAVVRNIDVTDDRSGQRHVIPEGRMVLVEDSCRSRDGYCQVVASDSEWHLMGGYLPRNKLSFNWPIAP